MGFGKNPIEAEKVEEAGDLLEESWFFENLLHSKTRTMSSCCSDPDFGSCLPPPPAPHPRFPPLCETQEHVSKNERKSSNFSSRKQLPVAPPSLTRTPSMQDSRVTQSFLMKTPNPSPSLTRASSMSTTLVGSYQEDDAVKDEQRSSRISSRKQPPIAPPSLTRTPSLPTSTETRSFLLEKPNPSPSLMRASSMSTFVVGSDHEDEEDQESEFAMGRLIRQASMNSSHTSNPPRQTSKAMQENLVIPRYQQKKPELDKEKLSDTRKLERNRSKSTNNTGKNKGGGAPAIPGGWVDKSSSEDIKAHIKFWARAVASNVRQEC